MDFFSTTLFSLSFKKYTFFFFSHFFSKDDTIYKMAEHAVKEYNVTNETGCIDYCEKTRDPLLTIALSQMKRAVFECMNDTRKGGHLEFGSNSAGNNHLNGIEEEEEEDEDQFNENETKSKAREEGEDLRPYLWDDSVIPTNGVVDVETTKAFHRIFSAMQFMYCEPSYRTEEVEGNVAAPPPIDDRQEFGDGLAWCGIALIHVLNQKARYVMLMIKKLLVQNIKKIKSFLIQN